MEHIAIDLGGKESQICVRGSGGEIVLEKKHPTRHLGRLLKSRPTGRVVLETSAEAFRIADQALACGHQVRVVAATLVRSLGVGARGFKTDQRDARILSEVSTRIDLPSVHVPRATSSVLGALAPTSPRPLRRARSPEGAALRLFGRRRCRARPVAAAT